MDFHTHRHKLLKDLGFKKAYIESGLEYQIARSLIKARLKKGLTQKELADKINTKQSVISRVENAGTTPSLSFLRRVAEALNTSLQVELK